MSIWEWLSKKLEDVYEQERLTSSSELGRFLQHVENILETRPTHIHIDAADFLSDFAPQEAIFKLKQTRKRFMSVDKDATLALASSIIQTWFNFPPANKYETQAWFVRELMEYIGPRALLLNDIWKAAHNINVHVLGIGKNVHISRTDIQNWSRKHLAGHILADKNSLDYSTLCAIDTEINAIISSRTSEASTYRTGLLNPPAFDNPSLPNQMSLQRPVTEQILQPEESLGSETDKDVEQPVESEDKETDSGGVPDQAAFDKFYLEVELLYTFLDNPLQHIAVPGWRDTDAASYWTAVYQNHVMLNSDKKLPFRDHAISR